jgi:DNA-binding NtrC family response regulator
MKSGDMASIEKLLINSSEMLLKLSRQGIVRGFITRIKPGEASWARFTFYQSLLMGKSIFDFYKIPKEKDLTRLAGKIKSIDEFAMPASNNYPSKNVYENYDRIYSIFANFPYSAIYLKYYKPMGFLGIIHFNPIVVTTDQYSRFFPLVFIDENNKIQGLNTRFINCFYPKKRSPAGLLDSLVQHCIRPNPVHMISRSNKNVQHAGLKNWTKLLSLDFSNIKLSRLKEAVEPNTLSNASGTWEWAPVSGNRFLPFKAVQDLEKNEYKLEMRFTLQGGELPSVILNGMKQYKDYFPDAIGYLAGPSYHEGYFNIKKEGSIIHRVPFNEKLKKNYHVIEVIKRGPCLAYFLNHKLIILYRDPLPIYTRESYMYLYCRRDTRIIPHTIDLYTMPTEPEEAWEFNQVSLLSGRANTFNFYQIIDDNLLKENRFHYGFILNDISQLKQDIKGLEKERSRIAFERDKYRAVLGFDIGKETMVGKNPMLLQIKKESLEVAKTMMTVLIEGRTGTGKEVLARFIHDNSNLRKGPFVKVDCSTLPDSLLESELFGVEKGAFTGAVESREGKLETAQGGTLFLDEVGNLNTATQAKLLQFLQDFTLERLGSTKKTRVETRIIAATNSPLKQLVDQGRFRTDLFYRMSAMKFSLPPLRDRPEDIEALCGHFLRRHNAKLNKNVQGISKTGMQKLLTHDWPGNIRELEHVLQKAVLFSKGNTVSKDEIDISIEAKDREYQTAEQNIPTGDPRVLTKEHILALLKKNSNIVERAARAAKISRATFYRKLKKFKIKVKSLDT